jgi:predicted GH43/DUF377 family glycosyl hydrolase
LISKANGSSVFEYNFNTAAFTFGDQDRWPKGLVVRVQDEKKHPEWANAGAITIVSVNISKEGMLVPAAVTEDSVVWPGIDAPKRELKEVWGVIDPRIALDPLTGTYYLTWDNCTRNCVKRQTMLSTTRTPFDHSSWQLHGQILSGADRQGITAGASLLFRGGAREGSEGAPSPHLAFVGNSNTAAALLLAESTDGIHWALPKNETRRIFMDARPKCWDAGGVAAGEWAASAAIDLDLCVY